MTMKITISGKVGEGKSTLAAVIVASCHQLGYTVYAIDDGEEKTGFSESVKRANEVRQHLADTHKDGRTSRSVKVCIDNTDPEKAEEPKKPYVVYVDGTKVQACATEGEGRQWLWFEAGRHPEAAWATLVHHTAEDMVKIETASPKSVHAGKASIE